MMITRLFLALAALALAHSGATAQQAAPRKPNIVFVLLDDAGFSDLGSYGGEIATPTFDTLAKQGVRFTNFHTAATCEASRAMLHSGVDNHLAGAGALMPVIADSQKSKPGYEGYLSERAHSLGTLMRDGGYATYFAGTWNLGHGLERGPGARGWDRYLGLEQTGADNYEAKVWAPFNTEAVWWQDGQRYVPPKDFFSTKTYVDTVIRYIDEGRSGGTGGAAHKPFFAMLSLQAVHSPLQAPQADIDKYAKRYQAGWDVVRAERYKRQVELGIMPAGLTMPRVPAALGFPFMRGDGAWASFSAAEQREFAQKMAVYAGMLDNADQHVGRLREHLKSIGELDNTVFVLMSDNGADFTDTSRINLPFRAWYAMNYPAGSDKLGGHGSYVHYGPYWAEVSNTPLALIKGSPGEGGMRVPFILSLPTSLKNGIQDGAIVDGFAYATDVLPTLLDLAGIALPGAGYKGKPLHRPTGHSLLPYLRGEAKAVHAADEALGFESLGAQALFKGDHKIMRMGAPFDGQWRLYDLKADPTESTDLSAQKPELLKAMLADVEAYNRANGVILPEPDYNPIKQLLRNNWPVLLQQLWLVLAAVLLVLGFAVWGLVSSWRRWRHGARRMRFAYRRGETIQACRPSP